MSTAPIWKKTATPEELNARSGDTAHGHLGLRFTEIGPDYLRATMPVDHRHVQPWRVLHGGISTVISETLGSTASFLAVPEGFRVVGIEINANHFAAVPEGETVTAECRPFHTGRTTQVWQTEIRRANGRLACVSRLTCAVLPE
ncbi:hotdog fold thioesterase [Roseomonas sp. SSH11]|uniref:Hotdog fold thioesterase n=1 Tax=Pararoseomonas baculiformis TaxID=2820812 RepID=A0ABS4A956_9PROT|nr:hotdog fold thioesterase [Pararoseomonas baculiformis]MBP0443535.1 hotdog fold thioesterase [Pararoseomonas baculiformis]